SKSIQVLTDEGGVPASYALLLEVDIPVPVTLKPRVRFWRVGEKAAPQEVAVSLDPAAAMTIAGLERQSDSDEPSAFDYEVQTVEEGREYVVRITPKSSGEKARDVFYLTSPDDDTGLLRKYPIYAYVR